MGGRMPYPRASDSAPLAPAVSASAGTSAELSRADHVHALPTIPAASNATPQPLGSAAAGAAATFSRADHVHASPAIPVASNASPAALAVTAAAGIAADFSRSDHAHPLPVVTPSTPSRAFATNFTPSATKAVLCTYSINLSVTNPLIAGSSTATVTLLSDTASTPTTERGRVSATSSVALAVAVAITQSQVVQLSHLCPAGHNMRMVLTTSGTASGSIVSQTEVAIG